MPQASFISKVLRQRGFAAKPAPFTLIVGLGNPGAEYARTRHNIGFMAVEALHDAFGLPPLKAKYESRWAEGTVGSVKVGTMLPQTFMNESGRAVGQAARFYKVPPERVIILHDELDLPLGEVRCKQGGGNAGHNGLKSTEAHLGSGDFWRIRIGIGHPGSRERVTGHVLGAFTAAERETMDKVIEALVDNRDLLLNGAVKELEQKLKS